MFRRVNIRSRPPADRFDHFVIPRLTFVNSVSFNLPPGFVDLFPVFDRRRRPPPAIWNADAGPDTIRVLVVREGSKHQRRLGGELLLDAR